MPTFTEVAFDLAFRTEDAQKALTNLQNTANKVAGDLTKNFGKAQQAQVKYAKGLQSVAKAQKASGKAQQEIQKAAEQSARAEEKRAAAAKKANDQYLKDLTSRKKIQEDVDKATQQSAKEVMAAQAKVSKQLKDGNEKTSEEVRKAEADLADAKIKFIEEEIAARKQSYDDRLKLAKGNADAELKLQKQLTDDLTKLEARKASASTQKQRAEAPRDVASFGGKEINRGLVEVGENFATISQSIQSGDVAGAFGVLGGVKGGLIGAAIDGIMGLGSALISSAKDAQAVGAAYEKLSANIQLNNADVTVGQLNQINVELKALQRPLGTTAEDVAKLASKVASFAPTDAIPETTDQLLNLQRIAKDVPIENLAAGVGRLGTAFGGSAQDIALAGDLIAQVGQQLEGVAAVGTEEAITELGTVYSKAALTIKDTNEAAKQSAAVFTALTKSGFEVGEATSAAEEIFLKLNDAVKDPKVLDTITKALPEGMSAMDAGLEKGNVSATKFISALEGMGDKGQDLAVSLGGTAGEALQFMLTRAEKTGTSLSKIAGQFDNVEGAAKKIAVALTPTSEKLQEISTQRFDDMATNFGSMFVGAMESGQQALVGVVDSLAGMDLGPLGRMFFDASVEAERAANVAEIAQDQFEAFKDFNESLEGVEGPEFFSAVNDQIKAIEADFPGAAAAIQDIQNNLAEEGTQEFADQMAEVRDILTEVEETTAADAFLKLQESIEATRTEMAELTAESDGMFDSIEGFAAGLQELVGVPTEIANQTRRSFSEMKDDATASLESLRAERDKLKGEGVTLGGDTEEAARLREIMLEIGAAQNKVAEATSAQRTAMEQALSAAQRTAETTSHIEDEEERRFAIMQAMGPLIQQQPEMAAAFGQNLDKIIAGEELRVDHNGAIVEGIEKQAEAEEKVETTASKINSLYAEQTKTMESQGVVTRSQLDTQLQQNKALDANLQQQIGNLKAQVGVLDAILAGQITREEGEARIAKLQENQLQLLEDQKRVEAGGQSSGVKAMEAGGGGDVEAQRDALKKQISDLEDFRASINESTAEIKANKAEVEESVEAHKKGFESAEAMAKAEEDAEKAIQDEIDTRDKAAEEEKKRAEERDKYVEDIQKKSEDRRKKQESARAAANAAAVKAQDELRKKQQDYAKKLADLAIEAQNQLNELSSQAAARAQTAADQILGVSNQQSLMRALSDPANEKGVNDWLKAQERAAAEAVRNAEQEQRDAQRSRDLRSQEARAIERSIEPFVKFRKMIEEGTRETGRTSLRGTARYGGDAGLETALRTLIGEGGAFDATRGGWIDEEVRQVQGFISDAIGALNDGTQQATDVISALLDQISNRIGSQESELAGLYRQLNEATSQRDVARSGVSQAQSAAEQTEEFTGQVREVSEIIASWDRVNAALVEYNSQIQRVKELQREIATAAPDDLPDLFEKLASTTEESRRNFTFLERVMTQLGAETEAARKKGVEFNDDAEKTILTVRRLSGAMAGETQALVELTAAQERAYSDLSANQQLIGQSLAFAEEQTNKQEQSISALENFTKAQKTSLDALMVTAQDLVEILKNENLTVEERIRLERQLKDVIEAREDIKGASAQGESAAAAEDLASALSNLSASAGGGAFDTLVDSLQEFQKVMESGADSATKAVTAVQFIGETVSKLPGMVQQTVVQIGDLISAAGQGDVGAAISSGADLTMDVGKALLNIPGPVGVAGAVILGVGMVAKAVSEIIALFKRRERTSSEQAQHELGLRERLLDIERRRLEMLERRIARGDREVDQAREQLAIQEEIANALLRKMGIQQGINDLDAESLEQQAEENQLEIDRLDQIQKDAEFILEGSRKQRREFLEGLGYDVDAGTDTKDTIEQLIEDTKAELIERNARGDEYTEILELQNSLMATRQQMLEEEIAAQELLIELGGDQLKALEKIERLTRGELSDAFKDAFAPAGLFGGTDAERSALEAFGLVDSKGNLSGLEDLNKDQMDALFKRLLEEAPEGEVEGLVELISKWRESAGAVEEYADAEQDLFERKRTMLEQQRDLERLTQTEFFEKTLDLLEEELAKRKAIEEQLIANTASEAEILDAANSRREIELDIKNLLEEQNQDLLKGDQLLTRLVRKRQQMLIQMRQQGGDMTPAQRAQLDAATQSAVARMREIGATEEQVKQFLASLPQFEKGGFNPSTGPRMLHAGEFVLPANIVSEIGRDELERLLSNSPSNMMNSMAARMITATASRRDAAAMSVNNGATVININLNISLSGAATAEDGRRVAEGVTPAIESTVQKLVNEGRIRVDR